MPTTTLTDRRIASLRPTGGRVEYFDLVLPGFGVRISPDGHKCFIVFYRVTEVGEQGQLIRKQQRATLGVYPEIKLAKARELARDKIRKADAGRDPNAERKQAQGQSFGALGALYLDKHAKRRKRSWRDDARMIRKELSAWDARPVTSIRRVDVRNLLEGIVDRGAPVLANRVLSLVRKVLNFALDQEWIDANPAQRMAPPTDERSRTRVLTAGELRAVWQWLAKPAPEDAEATERKCWTLNRAALTLRLVTAQRGGEVVAMRWQDVDLKAGWWTIPAEHAKNKMPHRVPLTKTAIKMLKTLTPKTTGNVFTGIRGTRQRRGALDGLDLKDVRPHDFRRTAATMMTSAGVPRLVVGMVLNHAEKGVTAIYDRHGYDAEKRTALETWERTLLRATK